MDMDIATVSGVLGAFFLASALYRMVRAHRRAGERSAKAGRGGVRLRDPFRAADEEEGEAEAPGVRDAVLAAAPKTYVWR